MKIRHVSNENGIGGFTLADSGDYEYENPIKKIRDQIIEADATFQFGHLELSESVKPTGLSKYPKSEWMKILLKKSHDFWLKRYDEIMKVEQPLDIFELLQNPQKKQQIKILKSITLNHLTFLNFIFKAYTDFGYTLSQYKSSHLPKDYEDADLPSIIYLEKDDSVTKIGETKLSEGQMKHIVNHRKDIVAKILDNGDNWHCFFLTYDSIGGKENYKDGQSHMHYISNKWGLSRDNVVEQIKSKWYKLPSVHVHYEKMKHND